VIISCLCLCQCPALCGHFPLEKSQHRETSPCQLHQYYTLLHVIYYKLLSSAIDTIIAAPNLKLIIISEYLLEYLRSSHYLAKELRVCHLDMPFNHIAERKDCINHRLYLSLADPAYYFFQACLRSLSCPQ
jgi:hypothetical protein